jgi:hypothetical protein
MSFHRIFRANVFCLLVFATAFTLPAASPFSQTQFTPDISLILDCSFHYFSHQDRVSDGSYPFQIHPGTSTDMRAIQWNYLELAFSSVVDPYFDFFANIVLEDGEIEVEEAFVKTRFLPAGFSMKIGRFLSAFGRLNGIHEHQWTFDTAPLVYQQAFGDILSEKGAQLTWVPPTDFYLMLGAEYLLGENETSFYRGSDPKDTGMGIVTGFVKGSFDLGNWVVLAGASMAHGGHRWDLGHAIPSEGHSTVWGTDLTIKYQIDSYRHILLQGEYLGRTVNPTNIYLSPAHQHGGYLDLVWRMDRRWRSAVRVDWLNVPDSPQIELQTPLDFSAMVEFNPTEFSRIRLFYQLNRHQVWQDERFTAHQVGVSLNVAIGAHGAHAF